MTKARSSADFAAGGPQVAGRNPVINGGFDIWQRGTSSTTLGSYATADRWVQGTFSGTGTFAQDSSNIVQGTQFSMRFTASATSQPYLVSVIETQNVLPFVGQQVTLSGYLATSTSANVQLSLQYTTSTDSAWNATYTSLTPTSGTEIVTTTTTLARKSVTYTIPSNARTLRVIIVSSGTMATSSTLTIGAVQLEIGSVATPFSRAGGTIAGELAACQRYYTKSYAQGTAPGTAGSANIISAITPSSGTGAFFLPVRFPVTMRGTPTITAYDSAGASGKVFKGADGKTAFTQQFGDTGGRIGTNDATSTNELQFYYTADAEL